MNKGLKIKKGEIVLHDIDEVHKKQKKIWNTIGLHDYDPNSPIKRGELAVLLDDYFMAFSKKNIDLKGKYLD